MWRWGRGSPRLALQGGARWLHLGRGVCTGGAGGGGRAPRVPRRPGGWASCGCTANLPRGAAVGVQTAGGRSPRLSLTSAPRGGASGSVWGPGGALGWLRSLQLPGWLSAARAWPARRVAHLGRRPVQICGRHLVGTPSQSPGPERRFAHIPSRGSLRVCAVVSGLCPAQASEHFGVDG